MGSVKPAISELSLITITLIVMIIFFVLGMNFSSETKINVGLANIGFDSHDFFLKILKNNLLVASVILLGSISYCVISFCVVGYSSFIIGLSYMSFANSSSYLESFILLAPHGIIEIVWIILLVISAREIAIRLFDFLRNDDLNPSHILNRNGRRRLKFSMALIVLGALIEAYVSLPLYMNILDNLKQL